MKKISIGVFLDVVDRKKDFKKCICGPLKGSVEFLTYKIPLNGTETYLVGFSY